MSDGSTVQVLDGQTHAVIRVISKGLNYPDGLWVDAHGNLYVTNNVGGSVAEFAPGASIARCRYSAGGLSEPIDVTTDGRGDVYVADFRITETTGYIYEYAQCTNKLVKRYAVQSRPNGLAVDKRGDIFVSYSPNPAGAPLGAFEEFVRGNAKPTPLKATVGAAGDIILDSHENIIAEDQLGSSTRSGGVDIIAPPYTKVKTIAFLVAGDMHDLCLTKDEKTLYSANSSRFTGDIPSVTAFAYPSGRLVTTIGAANGITAPQGVGCSPNATF